MTQRATNIEIFKIRFPDKIMIWGIVQFPISFYT